MNIFISGINGFVGSHLSEALQKLGHNVLGCDIVAGGREVIHGDCRNFKRMREWLGRFNTNVVVHCAAFPHEGLSVFSPTLIGDSIYRGSVATFSAAIATGVRRIVHLSSMSRYGAIPSPFYESDEPKPVDPYGIAKLASERTLECLAKIHDIEYVIAIPHSIYGPRQCHTDPYRNVLAIWMNQIMQGHAPTIYGGGTQKRCFSYIDDVIPCFVKMATANDPEMLGRIINVGPDTGEVSINEASRIVSDAMGYNGPPVYYPARPAEVHQANCSGELSRALLGYRPKVSLQDGIYRMAEWAKSVGPMPFQYNHPLEILSDKTPRTWTERGM